MLTFVHVPGFKDYEFDHFVKNAFRTEMNREFLGIPELQGEWTKEEAKDFIKKIEAKISIISDEKKDLEDTLKQFRELFPDDDKFADFHKRYAEMFKFVKEIDDCVDDYAKDSSSQDDDKDYGRDDGGAEGSGEDGKDGNEEVNAGETRVGKVEDAKGSGGKLDVDGKLEYRNCIFGAAKSFDACDSVSSLISSYEIATLKDRVKKLEKKRRSRTYKPRRLYKVGLSRRIESTDDASLGAQEDASKQGRKIVDLDADIEVTLIDETQGRNDEDLMFDAGVLNSDEVFQEPIVNTDTTTKSSIPVSAADPVTTTGEVVTTASVEIPEELTLAQTLIEIKSEEHASASTPIVSPLQLPQAKDKGKAKMVEPEKPLKKKDQIAIDEEVARNLEAQLQAELEEEERLSRQKEEEANIALIESWDNTQAMMDADFQLAQQMQTEEQEQLSIEEKSKLFVELLEKRNKNFAALRAQEKRNKPPTKAQKRNTMSTYLTNIAGYKQNPLKSKSYDEIQEMFDKEMKRINTFIDMDTELVKGSKTKAEGSFKRAREELESDNSKKQRIDEHVEAKGDDDQEEAEMNKHMEIVQDDEMLQNIDREDLETLWKLVKSKHGNTRPEEAYERVLWGDLKVMFELDIESEVWRSLEGHNVTVWKLFSSSGVHFVRFKNLHIFMLVEKKYPLTPATITGMLNKKLQVDQWNEIKFQLLNAFVSAAYTKVNAADMKVTTAERLQLLEECLLLEG
ncbi:hypothetical protein Tco_0769176 [Tanacetum coccineum]|uniref:Uncharacterized protein n=1 Tax=Tanacetum coccineum TaxID=301880 RepID=A0ABQ4Z9N0_9ASTR